MARLGRSYVQPRPRLVQPVPSPPQTVDVAGIPTGEAFGTASINRSIDAVGIGSAEAFGAASVEQQITPTGIATAEVFGAVEVDLQAAWLIMPASLPSAEAFGTPEVRNYGLAPASITSAEAFGAATVTVGPVDVGPSGIPSAEVFGTLTIHQLVEPLGIPSVEAFGTPTIHRAIVPAGIPSAEAFGTAVIAAVIAIVGIATGEAFGTTSINPQINPTGIPSAEEFGATVVAGKVRVTRVTPDRAVATYDLVAVAYIPAASGPPTLVELDPISWVGLTWTNELSRPQTLSSSCQIASLTEPVLQRLRRLSANPTELWLYRNGTIVFAGRLETWRSDERTLTMESRGLLGYFDRMVVETDTVFSQVDQFQIVKGLVDASQGLDHGHYGIDTSAITTSGMARDATYLRAEGHYIGQRVLELGQREGGFDIEVDPASRRLQLWAPQKGVDRSSGEDAIVFDARNITNGGVLCSVVPGDVVTDALGAGTSSGGDTLYGAVSNDELRAQYGRSASFSTFDSVSEQVTLDAHLQGVLDARGEALLVPGPDLRVTPDADLGSYAVGDTTRYELSARLGVEGAFRIRRQQVVVEATGLERVSLQFV